MTPKEKAKELVEKYFLLVGDDLIARYCAQIAVSELQKATPLADKEHVKFYIKTGFIGFKQFWDKVAKELL